MLKISNRQQFTNYVLLIGAILVVLNLVAYNLFGRLDLTDNSIFTLSQSSRDVIGKLDSKLTAKAYFSGTIPGAAANSRRYLQDMLEEYQAYSAGNFKFEFVDPDEDEKAQQQAQTYGIPPVQLQVVENDKLEIKNVYMGLVLLFRDKKEPIPVIQSTQGLEYNLTATIKKLTATNLKNVGLISPESEEISTQNLSRFLEQIYSIRQTTLTTDIPDDVTTLILNGFTDSLKSEELYRLDQFIMRGGHVFIGQSSIKDFLQQGFAMEIKSNIFDFLKHYGVNIGKDLVIDQKCSQIQMQSQQGFFTMRTAVDYPALPMIQRFNPDHILTKHMAVMKVFFVSEVSPVEGGGFLTTPLMYTSEHTGLISGPFFQIHPTQSPAMKIFPYGPKSIALLVEGPAKSYFSDSSGYSSRPGYIGANPNVRLIAIGDNQFFNDRRAGGVQENMDFILNAVDYLSGDEELIQIRSRDLTQRPLETLSDASRRSWKWFNLGMPVVLVLLMGIFKWRGTKMRRKILEDLYAK